MRIEWKRDWNFAANSDFTAENASRLIQLYQGSYGIIFQSSQKKGFSNDFVKNFGPFNFGPPKMEDFLDPFNFRPPPDEN